MRGLRREVVPYSCQAKCKGCGADIAWMYSSKRTGRSYPTNVLVCDKQLVTFKLWFHKCEGAAGTCGVKHNLMRARFAGKCAACGGRIQVGEAIAYDRATKKARHGECAEQQDRKVQLQAEADKFNAQWAGFKNEHAELERKQEEAAFMSDPDFEQQLDENRHQKNMCTFQ